MGEEDYTTTNSSNGVEPTKSTEPTREQIKMEFYKTYDVMTGVRIAVTLGGFFSLLVLLVVYKSKCKSRSISEENLEATVAAAIEEEQIGFAIRKGYSLYSGTKRYTEVQRGHTRFSSVGGGYNMYAPPIRYALPNRGRVSLPTSSPFFYPPLFNQRNTMDSPPPKPHKAVCEDFDEVLPKGPTLLCVPSSRRSSRRLSSITCSSCDTSYLERRGSSMEMGRPIAPPFTGPDRLEEEPWDFYYPIDIQVIQPTPEVSPAESQISIFKCDNREPVTLSVPRIAPLASISSCRIPSIEQDSHSIGSDSVFLDEELIDTEDEVEGFSTDSDADNLECISPSKTPRYDSLVNKQLCSKSIDKRSDINRVPNRRFSSPLLCRAELGERLSPGGEDDKKPTSSSSSFISTLKSTLRTSSDSDTLLVSKGAVDPKKSLKPIPRTMMSASCDHLVKVLQEHASQSDVNTTIVEHCSWSQETLF